MCSWWGVSCTSSCSTILISSPSPVLLRHIFCFYIRKLPKVINHQSSSSTVLLFKWSSFLKTCSIYSLHLDIVPHWPSEVHDVDGEMILSWLSPHLSAHTHAHTHCYTHIHSLITLGFHVSLVPMPWESQTGILLEFTCQYHHSPTALWLGPTFKCELWEE